MLYRIFTRPSSRWDLGGDVIHEDEVYQTDNEKNTSLPQLADAFKDRTSIDLTRWQSTDRLKSLCRGIDLNQTTDDEMSMSLTSHKREVRQSHERIKPWLNVCQTILTSKGKITAKELLGICEKKKAHFTNRQDHDFKGFESIEELFDCMGVSMEKVGDIIMVIYSTEIIQNKK